MNEEQLRLECLELASTFYPNDDAAAIQCAYNFWMFVVCGRPAVVAQKEPDEVEGSEAEAPGT